MKMYNTSMQDTVLREVGNAVCFTGIDNMQLPLCTHMLILQ